jgi:DNA-binding beta-propeller fold protein YncE
VNSIENTLSLVGLGPPPAPAGRIAVPGPASGFGDLQHAAVLGGLVYVVNSSASRLVAIDPVARLVVDEVSLTDQPFAFPQALDFVGGKAYVALNGLNTVAVVDVSSVPGRLVTTIPLSSLAVTDAAAMPARVRAVGGRVFVTLNHLSPTTFSPVPGANGRVAIIDATTDAVVAAQPFVDLGEGCKNPSDLAVEGETLWVTCGWIDFFGTGAVQGGGFVPVSLGSTVAAGAVIPTTQAPGSLAFCDGIGFAGDAASGTILRLDPVSRQVTAAPAVCPANVSGNAFVGDVVCAR